MEWGSNMPPITYPARLNLLERTGQRQIIYAILYFMIEERHIWRIWSRVLHRWGLHSFAAWLLEATAPVHILGAQAVYISQPLLSLFIPQEHSHSLARLLEQPDQARQLALFLQEGPVQ